MSQVIPQVVTVDITTEQRGGPHDPATLACRGALLPRHVKAFAHVEVFFDWFWSWCSCVRWLLEWNTYICNPLFGSLLNPAGF